MFKKIILSLIMTHILSVAVFSQDFYDSSTRIGLKAGSPNVFGLGFEYVLPYGINWLRVGMDADVSYFPIKRNYLPFLPEKFENTELNVLFVAVGPRLYFNEDADGFSFGVYAGRYQLELTQEYQYLGQTSSATVSLGLNIIMAKIGWRWLWGNTTLSVDAGYGQGKFDDTIEVTVNYPKTGKRTEIYNIEDILPVAKGIVFSVEAGFAF